MPNLHLLPDQAEVIWNALAKSVTAHPKGLYAEEEAAMMWKVSAMTRSPGHYAEATHQVLKPLNL